MRSAKRALDNQQHLRKEHPAHAGHGLRERFLHEYVPFQPANGVFFILRSTHIVCSPRYRKDRDDTVEGVTVMIIEDSLSQRRTFDAYRACFLDYPEDMLAVLAMDRRRASVWDIQSTGPQRRGGADFDDPWLALDGPLHWEHASEMITHHRA